LPDPLLEQTRVRINLPALPPVSTVAVVLGATSIATCERCEPVVSLAALTLMHPNSVDGQGRRASRAIAVVSHSSADWPGKDLAQSAHRLRTVLTGAHGQVPSAATVHQSNCFALVSAEALQPRAAECTPAIVGNGIRHAHRVLAADPEDARMTGQPRSWTPSMIGADCNDFTLVHDQPMVTLVLTRSDNMSESSICLHAFVVRTSRAFYLIFSSVTTIEKTVCCSLMNHQGLT
jgi:hypothetical protein